MSTKNSHLDWSDEAFLHDFGACSFPAELFDHEAHLRLAWLHLQQVTIDQAIILVTQQLKKYVQHLGAAEKYHATVTVAGVELVHHFLKKGTTSSFEEYLLKYPMVKTAFKELINSHYQEDIFQCPTAKAHYLAPNWQPFR